MKYMYFSYFVCFSFVVFFFRSSLWSEQADTMASISMYVCLCVLKIHQSDKHIANYEIIEIHTGTFCVCVCARDVVEAVRFASASPIFFVGASKRIEVTFGLGDANDNGDSGKKALLNVVFHREDMQPSAHANINSGSDNNNHGCDDGRRCHHLFAYKYMYKITWELLFAWKNCVCCLLFVVTRCTTYK